MRTTVAFIGLLLAALILPSCARAQGAAPTTAPSPTTAPAGAKLPHVHVDVTRRQVRVDAQTLGVDAPL